MVTVSFWSNAGSNPGVPGRGTPAWTALPRSRGSVIVLRAARWADVDTGEIHYTPAVVVVEGNRITAVDPAGSADSADRDRPGHDHHCCRA